MITSRAFPVLEFIDKLSCSVAAAILGAGVLSAGASMWGANKAADAQTNAGNAAIANQRDMYGQNKNLLTPFINAGQSQLAPQQALLDPNNASGPLNALMKLLMPGADQSATLAQTPGYQFSLNQGTRAANNQLAARGLGGSGGAVAKGVTNYAEGLAGNTWQSVVNSLQNLFSSSAGAGQSFINTGANAGNALAGVGANTANSITGSLTGVGNAQAAGANATGAAVGGLGSSLSTAALIQKLTGNGSGGGGSVYGGNTGFTAADASMNQQLFPGYGTG